MRILWSISTTVRNPERLRDFLRVLKKIEGNKFDEKMQVQYQILLIKERLYTPMRIPLKYIDLIKDPSKEIPYSVAREIFEIQNYKDPPMRGRQSVNPLNKLGFSIAKERMGAIRITPLGNLFISPKADISYIFFKSLLKLQFPNPMSIDFNEKKGFNIRPFIAAMHLMKKTDGLSQREFSLFIPTLINFRDIEKYVIYVYKLRKIRTKKEKDAFIRKFLEEFYRTNTLTDKQLKNPFEYGDNTMRYFRLTKYFRVIKQPWGQWKIELEPTRMKEIEQLLAMYDGSATQFKTTSEYITYMSDIKKPSLPWEFDLKKSKDIAVALLKIVNRSFESLNENLKEKVRNKYNILIKVDIDKLELKDIEKFIEELRSLRSEMIQIERDNTLRKNLEELKRIVSIFKDKSKLRRIEPVEFEYLISQCLKILNDEIEIKPNCILDDNGNPISFAPGNKADIEGYYETFNSIFEATLDVSRNQVYRESVPVMRHLRDFEQSNPDKPSFCVFIAPKIHADTINYFWYSVKYGFEGRKQNIVALELSHFVEILESFINIVKKKPFSHYNLKVLLESIVSEAEREISSINWFKKTLSNIKNWESSIIGI